MIKSFLK